MKSSIRAVFLFTLLATGCHGSRERESASLQVAVDRYRGASNAERPARLDELGLISCSDPLVCEAKAACIASFRATTEALTLRDEVVAGLAEVKSGELGRDDDRAVALPMKLEVAKARLDEGKEKLPLCEQSLVALRVPSRH